MSGPYASQLASGKRRPPLDLAVRIYERTGAKLGPLENRTDAEIETLRQANAILDTSPAPVAGSESILLVGSTPE